MAIVTIEGEKSFEVQAGTKLVLAVEDAGIDILHKCGGNARCTTCRVQLLSGELAPMADLERERLARESTLGPDIRLSCQVRVESDLNGETGVTGENSKKNMDKKANRKERIEIGEGVK